MTQLLNTVANSLYESYMNCRMCVHNGECNTVPKDRVQGLAN